MAYRILLKKLKHWHFFNESHISNKKISITMANFIVIIRKFFAINFTKFHICMNVLLTFEWFVALSEKCPYSELFWSAFFPHFPAFGLNTERYKVYDVSLRIQSKCGKIQEKCGPEQLQIRTCYAVLAFFHFQVVVRGFIPSSIKTEWDFRNVNLHCVNRFLVQYDNSMIWLWIGFYILASDNILEFDLCHIKRFFWDIFVQ